MARKRTLPQRSGVLNIDKPPGWTSHDVVARVRRIVGERQVGHAGTLDPAASGVLPVAVGHATKILPYIEDATKAYVATVRFGVTTDSGDRDGRLLSALGPGSLSARAIEDVLGQFRGDIAQVPPMHSAIKVGGQKLYDLARKGIEVDVPTRTVTIHAIELVDWIPPDATIRVECSSGTYIRSLARDLGEALGTGAMLAHLVRVRAGRFHLATSIPIDRLEERLETHGWLWIAVHPDDLLIDAPIVVLDADDERRWFNGLGIRADGHTGIVRVYDTRREWVGIGLADAESGVIQPKRVVRGERG